MALSEYISHYSGGLQILRCLQFAKKSENPEDKVQAYRLSVELCRAQTNTGIYTMVREAMTKDHLVEVVGPEGFVDAETLGAWDRAMRQQIDKREVEISQARNSGMKETIRLTLNEQGRIYHNAGNFNMAIKTFMRGKDLAPTPENQHELCYNLISSAIPLNNWAFVHSNAVKALSLGKQIPLHASVAHAIIGLYHIENRNYHAAAVSFINITKELLSNFTDFVTDQDITLYAGLCALASFDREELKEKLLGSANFKPFLELNPQVVQLVDEVLGCRYQAAISSLTQLTQQIEYDFFLGAKAEELLELIRSRTIAQFLVPYKCIRLETVAEAFNTTAAGIEGELVKLIQDGILKARVDSHNGTLVSKSADPRSRAFRDVLELGSQFLHDTQGALLRMSLIKDKVILNPPTPSPELTRQKSNQ
jgi:COP9 signalosome complex subunit 1